MTDFDDTHHAPPDEYTADQSSSPGTDADIFAFPLSPVQERMWYAVQENPLNPSHNGSFRWNLEGNLNPACVEATFNEIVRRHESLRTTFAVSGGSPVQIVIPRLQVHVDTVDLRGLLAEMREHEMDRLCAAEARHPFDLHQGPLVRVALLQMEEHRHILMLTLHQLIADGWSIGLIMEEFQQIYSALAEHRQPALAPLPIQYADYAIWKNEQFESPELAGQLNYWKEKLAGYKRLEITPDFTRPPKRTTNAEIVSEMLPRSLTDTLKAFSNDHGGSMFITSLAACMVLLKKYSGKCDISVGSPLAGRTRTDIESLIGLFVNHIVLRTSIEGDPLFSNFACQVRDSAWEAFGHQDIPFENVLKALRPGASDLEVFHDPFFVINFICQREYARASEFVFEFVGLKMSTMPSKSQGALYDLNFFLVERQAGWRLNIEYNTDIYSQQTIARMFHDFRTLLDEIARDPNRRLSQLLPDERISEPAESPSAVESAKESVAPADADGSPNEHSQDVYAMPSTLVQERFWLLSKLSPGNPAFHMPACVRLSGALSADILEKSFLSLAERHEILRTTFAEDNNQENGSLLQLVSSRPTFSLDRTLLPKTSLDESTLAATIRQETQRPFDLQEGPLWRAKLFELSDDDHILVITMHHIIGDGWSHNVLQKDLWTIYESLTCGAQPHLPPLAVQYGDFAAWQKEWLSSAEAQEHLDFWLKELSGNLKTLDFPTDHPPHRNASPHGGLETLLLPAELTASLKIKSQAENATLFMFFTTGFAALLSRYANQPDVIIGSPVANRRAETENLIGSFSGPTAIRVRIPEGATLASVLNKVRDTTFNALAHSELPFELLLEKLNVRSMHGRNPLFQFYLFSQAAFLQPRKVRDLKVTPMPTVGLGTPFELQMGIIERAEGVRLQLEYNADLFDRSTIERILLDFCSILRLLATKLDTRVDEIALSPSLGPANSLAAILPHPISDTDISISSDEPQNDIEKRLAIIWKRLLGIESVGCHQNYFDLGGTSLGAVRLFAEIQKEFKVQLPLAALFEAQTIAELSRLLVKDNSTTGWSSLVPIQTKGSRPPFFCVHGGGGNVLIYRALSTYLGDDQPFYGLQSQGLDGHRPLLTRVEDMAALYIRELQRVQPHGPYFLGGYCMGGTVALEMAQQLMARGEKIAALALFDTANWAAIRRNGFLEKMVYQTERLVFHLRNFGLLDYRRKVEFIKDKLNVLSSRKDVWRGWFTKRFGRHSEFALLARIWELNDQAILDYKPSFYAGTLTDFRPMRQYSQYRGAPMDWSKVVRTHEIVTLPVFPAGMLVEPFVQDLARALRKSMDANIDAPAAQLRAS